MLRIEYKIITQYLGEIEDITDEEIHYDFLPGNVSLLSSNIAIEMEWEWIPLLDFAYCLKRIVSKLKTNDNTEELFEFTENAETLKFSKQQGSLKIFASFSSIIIETTYIDFEKAVYEFNINISKHIRKNISDNPKSILQKYLYIEE